MSEFLVRSFALARPALSMSFQAVCLFSLIGLAVAAAIVLHIPPQTLAWILLHAE